jgi:hypothetical protein
MKTPKFKLIRITALGVILTLFFVIQNIIAFADPSNPAEPAPWDNWRISPDCRWTAWVKTVLNKDKNEWDGNNYKL